jgi:hypothetical protein
MRKYKLYLETSVWNFYYADDAPDLRDITRSFFGVIDSFEIFVAEPVLEEIDAAAPEVRDRLRALVAKHGPEPLPFYPEIRILAEEYLKIALPARARLDAFHIAHATYHELDFVISWNMKHIASVNRQEKVRAVNRAAGYTKELSLITPAEVSSHAD